jgi:hypothetical protein
VHSKEQMYASPVPGRTASHFSQAAFILSMPG